MKPTAIKASHTCVFVLLNRPKEPEPFFVVPGGAILADTKGFFGASLRYKERPAVNFGPLKPYEDKWELFDE